MADHPFDEKPAHPKAFRIEGYGSGRPVYSGKSPNKTAFPEPVEPKGRLYFGPAPPPPRPTTGNIYNTDPKGRKKPWTAAELTAFP